jgi:subtilase family serine protease
VLFAAALVAAPIALGATHPAAATTPTLHVLVGNSPPPLPSGARLVATIAPSTSIALDVALNVRNGAELQSILAGLYDRHSPWFHHFLKRGQFASAFGATSDELAAVETWLRSVGLTPTGISGNRLVVHATGTLGVTAKALHTSFAAVRLVGGKLDFVDRTAPSVPAGLASEIQGIIGLDDLTAVHNNLASVAPRRTASHSVRTGRAPGPTACSALASAASYQGSFTAGGLASYYAMSPLYTLGDNGQGVRIAIAEFEPDWRTDVAWFERCYKATNTVNYVHIDGGAGAPGPGSGESALDIENVISLAPRATIDVYQTPNTDLGAEDMYAKMATTDVDKVITTSWGSCEPHTSMPVLASEAATFAQANLQGQVMFAAAGDSGSTDCFNDTSNLDYSTLAVDDPGSQAGVLSVGGTSAAAHAEVVWNSGDSAGGGGVSTVHCMPSYQDNVGVPNLINPSYSVPDTTSCLSGYFRQVPDVSAMADPATGYTVYVDGGLTAIGGTSGAAPLWAAAAALVLASPYCSYFHANVGVSPQSLYELAATPTEYWRGLRDIRSGNNVVAASGYAGSKYPALAGYDEASGLGSPTLTLPGPLTAGLFQPGLASLLCRTQGSVTPVPVVTSVAPNVAASTAPTTITVLGTGFMPISGAVRVSFDGRSFPAVCTTSTRCTVILNRLQPGTSDVRVFDQIYAESPASGADHVMVLASPTVTSLSPSKGPTTGRTRVTIRGTGFTGTVSVRFGNHTATQVTVVSPTKVVVTAPAGTGSVYVKVTATGGVSARTPKGLYRY